MSGFEGYKGTEQNIEQQNGIENISSSFDTQKDLQGLKDEVNQDKNQEAKKESIQQQEYIDTKYGEYFDSIGVGEKEKDILFEKISDISENNDKIDEVISFIQENEPESLQDIYDILGDLGIIREKIEEKQEKTEEKEIKEEQNSIELSINQKHRDNISRILKELKGENKELYSNIQDLIEKGNLDEALDKLKDKNTFKVIADDLRKQDEKNGTNNFQKFSESLVSIDISFEKQILDYKLNYPKEHLALGTNTTNGIDNLGGNVLSQTNKDGSITEVDITGRHIGIEGSDYRLGANLDNKATFLEAQKLEGDLKKELAPFNEGLKANAMMQEINAQGKTNMIEFKDIKTQMQTKFPEKYSELGIDRAGSAEEIQSILQEDYNDINEQKQTIIDKYKAKINALVEANYKQAQAIDTRKKQTLKFLNSIGFDMLPQGITDGAIDMINTNDGLRSSLGLTGKIDLANGLLGTEKDGDVMTNNAKEKANFAKMFNILISGSAQEPINITAIENGSGAPISDISKFSTFLENSKLKDVGVARGIMMKNISKYQSESKK